MNNEQIKIKKKSVFIVLAILIIIAALFMFFKKQDESENIVDSQEEQTEEIDSSGCPLLEDCMTEGKEVNAYDFIISVMSSPQYWGLDNLPLYNLDYEQEYSYEKLKAQNATGWILKDEKTASFYRGSEGVLTINFSSNSADIKTWSDVYSSSENGTLDYDASCYEFDFNNDIYKFIAPYENEELNHNYDNRVVINGTVYGPKTEGEFRESNDLFDERFAVKDILIYYEEIFEEAGCPLLNQPEGTLESYKNKTITVPKQFDDNLIHNIWDQENFVWDWDNNEDLVWLDNYQDIFNQQINTSEDLDKVETENGYLQIDTFNPLYLVLVNKKDCTSQYTNQDANSAKLILWLDEYFDAEGGAFATYFLKPMSEKIFGQSSVYYFDSNNLPKSEAFNFYFENKDDFLNNLTYPNNASMTSILTVYKNGDIAIGNVATEGDECYSMNYLLFNEMKVIAEHYQIEFPYADDYMFNFYLFYNPSAQRLLGLR